jgi:glycosyltransferase involved in cell wall biosynthesis
VTDQVAGGQLQDARSHVVVVEAYDGHLEFVTDEPEERANGAALGLPWVELVQLVNCRVTVLTWDEWRRCELHPDLPFTWASVRPVTRPSPPQALLPVTPTLISPRVTRRTIAARDPEHGKRLHLRGPGPRSHGLIAGTDPFFWLSYCLREELVRLGREDPFGAVIVPMWGGLGCTAQLSRVAGSVRELDVPFVVIVTDSSAQRYRANQEGDWTREAAIRRQMEDLSLALADLALAFGPRGLEAAAAGRLPDALPAVLAPRRMAASTRERIENQTARAERGGELRPFLYEPLQGSAGVLIALDAVSQLARADVGFASFVSAGPDCIFAPMRPRTFREYWSSRGFSRELSGQGRWTWQRNRPEFNEGLAFRVYPSPWEFLPDVASELARGSAVLLSPAAAEGLAPDNNLPTQAILSGDADAERLVDAFDQVVRLGVESVDEARRELCALVVDAHRGVKWRSRLEETASLLERVLAGNVHVPDAGRVMRLLLDRTRPLGELAGELVESQRSATRAAGAGATAPVGNGRLSTVMTCYEMGALLLESVHSVWAGERPADEVIVVDDGSRGEETRRTVEWLEREAAEGGRPLRVIRQRNRGLAAARNRGLAEATGEFVSFLDADDLLEPSFHRLAVPLLQRHPELGGVAAWALVFGESVPGDFWFWNAPQAEFPSLFVENAVIVPCVMRTELLRQLGGYDEGQRYNYEDWELSIRLLAAGQPILTIPEYLMRYRLRRDSLYRSMTDVQNQVMRERMLALHRDVVARFSVELTMLTEDRRMRAAADSKMSLPFWRGFPASFLDAARAIRSAVRGMMVR